MFQLHVSMEKMKLFLLILYGGVGTEETQSREDE